MLLYNNPLSGNCYKVRLLCAQLNVPLELRLVDVIDRSERPRLLIDLNPALRIPVLVLDDGRPIAESNAILLYLATGTDYLPKHLYHRSLVWQWLFFEQYSHEPHLAMARFWALTGSAPSEAHMTNAHQQGHYALRGMERHLEIHTFLVAERYTIADIALYAYTHMAEQGGFDLTPFPSIRAWLDRVSAQPGHISIDDQSRFPDAVDGILREADHPQAGRRLKIWRDPTGP